MKHELNLLEKQSKKKEKKREQGTRFWKKSGGIVGTGEKETILKESKRSKDGSAELWKSRLRTGYKTSAGCLPLQRLPICISFIQ